MNCARSTSLCIVSTSALMVALAIPRPAFGQTYSIREMPPLSGHSFSVATGVNDVGVTVGASGIADSVGVAVRWIDGVPESLGTLPGLSASMAFDVSNDGRVIGFGYTPNQGGFPIGLGRPFVWRDGVMTELPLPDGRAYGEASQIHYTGDAIVGAAYDWNSSSGFHNDVACRWDWNASSETWSATALGSLGGVGGYATNINTAGAVFGYASVESGSMHACRWDPATSTATDLGAGDGSVGTGGNDSGQSVGWRNISGVAAAYILVPEPAYGLPAGLTELGTLPETVRSAALLISNTGVVIGVCWNVGNFYESLNVTTQAFLWRNGEMKAASAVVPPDPEWTVKLLFDINDAGQCAGLGDRDGELRGVVLSECTGDVGGDFSVSLPDLGIVLANFGTVGGATYSEGDLDSDGDVDLSDLGVVLANFGAICE